MTKNSFRSLVLELFSFVFPEDLEISALRLLTPEQIFQKIPPAVIRPGDIVSDLDPAEPGAISAIWKYRDPLAHSLIWQLKYAGNKNAAECAGFAVSKFLATSMHAGHNTILIPIPLSKKRRSERGYNQCEWIIEAALRNLPSDIQNRFIFQKDILVRTQHRDRQTLKDRSERIQNARQIFAVENPNQIRGKNVIIIDDVVTTGSTFAAAREALLAAGAAEVICLAVAH